MKNWKKLLGATATLSLLLTGIHTTDEVSAKGKSEHSHKEISVEETGRYDSGAAFGEGGAEIVKYNKHNGYAYSINGHELSLDIIDVKNQKEGNIDLVKRIKLSEFGIEASDLTSVGVHPSGEYIAVSAPAKDKTDKGHVVLFNKEGEHIKDLEVGSLPDMVTFSKDGKKLMVANEGEPSDDYKTNPEGSVSVIDTEKKPESISQDDVHTLPFTKDNLPEDLRQVGPNKEDDYLNAEPEFISVDDNNQFAYVTLQESNALAKVDIQSNEIVDVKSMGYKDYSSKRNRLDASDKDDKHQLKHQPVLGMYQPDGIATYQKDGKTYVLTANEGDAQDYEGYSEETRVEDLKDQTHLKAKHYDGYGQKKLDNMADHKIFDEDSLGRLKVTKSHPFKDGDKHEAFVTYGGRSFSVYDTNLSQIFDSGDDLEKQTKKHAPDRFNAEYESKEEFEADKRSDNKGPEAESVEVGEVNGKTYAFVGLERTGGVMVYDISNPKHPKYVQYIYNKENKDISPEGITFIDKKDSPNGKPMLMVAHELTGTVTTYELD
ncbi:choice-of-anchor I family protein [Staphylococcus massiliensis]|uniref:Choice-of-anchor I domain-containing protein n=1 Tax=Staphylococcus massiliensis S46 TaxID=1229783 RepID=K9AX04_9STAP|nr:choice-of-anchor I family protein [Staphylococcus massiliensis]EKU47102.1 hypothetical protein C273_08356 [Staphylococcus massiliensis S46]POA01861.1 hypothetical protein CD133_00610 [Staphylococcus massiliensis CCUG 55927]